MRGMSPYLLPAGLAVETGIVAGTVEGLVLGVEGERIALMRAYYGEADDIAVRPDPAWNLGAELDQRAGSVGIRMIVLKNSLRPGLRPDLLSPGDRRLVDDGRTDSDAGCAVL